MLGKQLKGYFAKFYSWRIWKPLCKLSYSAYLVNLSIVMLRIYSMNRPPYKMWFDAVSLIHFDIITLLS